MAAQTLGGNVPDESQTLSKTLNEKAILRLVNCASREVVKHVYADAPAKATWLLRHRPATNLNSLIFGSQSPLDREDLDLLLRAASENEAQCHPVSQSSTEMQPPEPDHKADLKARDEDTTVSLLVYPVSDRMLQVRRYFIQEARKFSWDDDQLQAWVWNGEQCVGKHSVALLAGALAKGLDSLEVNGQSCPFASLRGGALKSCVFTLEQDDLNRRMALLVRRRFDLNSSKESCLCTVQMCHVWQQDSASTWYPTDAGARPVDVEQQPTKVEELVLKMWVRTVMKGSASERITGPTIRALARTSDGVRGFFRLGLGLEGEPPKLWDVSGQDIAVACPFDDLPAIGARKPEPTPTIPRSHHSPPVTPRSEEEPVQSDAQPYHVQSGNIRALFEKLKHHSAMCTSLIHQLEDKLGQPAEEHASEPVPKRSRHVNGVNATPSSALSARLHSSSQKKSPELNPEAMQQVPPQQKQEGWPFNMQGLHNMQNMQTSMPMHMRPNFPHPQMMPSPFMWMPPGNRQQQQQQQQSASPSNGMHQWQPVMWPGT